MAFCAVFLAVNLTLVLNSILEIGPVIFLRWTEWYHGEVDGYVIPSGEELVNETSREFFLNYTRVTELYNETYNLTPRKILGSSVITEL